ncbi:BcPKS8, polyketide synthase [Stipitochalara longipes BDJ]|nr:BcPKS8, polyketide synthase [Stipitochalara longipes BDJ]
MAPSATMFASPQEGTDSSNNSTADENEASPTDSQHGDSSPRTRIYTDAYTHGYTEGYIKGNTSPKTMPIAIVGMSCRLPGNVTTPDEFWELLSRARSGWSKIPKERFEASSFYHPNPGKAGCFNAVGGHFLSEDVASFDAPFFGLTSQEATSMDPQQRLLLECTFEALENAGIPKHEIVGKRVGVFIGGSFSEYEASSFTDADTIPMYQATGCAFAMQSNRISYFFDLRGPSFTLDTACSSSLVAVHQACQSIRNGECDTAIVGGCHLNMLPEFWVSMSNSRLFSDEGRSFSFDSRGTGYGRGEGCGIVVLKALDQALKDNDNVRSVIAASGVNQDGKTSGITMPNGVAQELLMKSVYKNAGLDPKETGYVEAHGTGTKVGDPIEVAALHKVFGEGRTARAPLFIGSVKSNVGHLEAASGIISVIKTAMMLERGFILPNYDFKKPNESIPFSKWNLKVPISQRPFPKKRFASINNFGFGGTNAHVVMEKAPYFRRSEEQEQSSFQSRKLFILCANDKDALQALMGKIGIYLEQRPEIFQNDLMSNLAYTLARGSRMQWRVAIPTESSFDLIQALNSGKVMPVRGEPEGLRIGFIFTGQGAQYYNMGRELYQQYPVYASTIDACDAYLASLGAPFSLLVEMNKDATESLINEAHISQPACTALQLALTDLLKSWGISPVAVAGHSSGEIGAAYAAGILSLHSCMAISYHRGMTTLGLKKFSHLKGSMMAVGASKEDIEPILAQLNTETAKASIACFNSPSSLTISGDEPVIDELQKIMEEKQWFARKLQVNTAYHSHHMDLVAEDYREKLQSLNSPQPTATKFYSSLYGRFIKASELQPSYWVDNLTQSVRFSEAVSSMCRPIDGYKTGVSHIVEIGPHSALAGPVKQILKACERTEIAYLSPLTRKRDAVETALDMASALFVKGVNLNLDSINLTRQQPELLIDMPRYPWNHKTRYWHEGRVVKKHKSRTTPRHDLLGNLANYSNDLEPTWRNILRLDDLPWLRHHQIQSLTLFPMSGFISVAVEAASQKAALRNVAYDAFHLRDVSVHAPLVLTDDGVELTLQLRPSSDTWEEFKIHSWTASKGWTEHCKGLITIKSSSEISLPKSTLAEMSSAETVAIDKPKLYDSLSKLGVSYGPSFQGMNTCEASDSCSKATITAIDTAQEMPSGFQTDSIIHPALLEQLIEMYWPILGAGRTTLDTVYLPSSIEDLTISRRIAEMTKSPGNSLRAFCKGNLPQSNLLSFHGSMFATATDNNDVLISVKNLTVSPIVEHDTTSGSEPARELCYKLEWEPIVLPSLDSSSSINRLTNGDHKLSNGVVNGIPNGITNGISSALGQVSDFPTRELIIVHGESAPQIELASEIAETVQHQTGSYPTLETFTNLNTDKTSGRLCLIVSELEQPILSSLTFSNFTALQKLVANTEGALWVVRGAYVSSTTPEANMIIGLSRSIRSETLLKFATLDVDPETLTASTCSQIILTVLQAVFGTKAEPNCELEFMEREGQVFAPRIVLDAEMDEYVHKETCGESTLEATHFVREGRSLEMVMTRPGVMETIHFIDQMLDDTLPGDEIELEVRAIGMNARDINPTVTSKFGIECSGTVTKIGSNVTNLAVGDRVTCLSVENGVYSTRTRTKASFAILIKDGSDFQGAASIPIAYCTAYYGLMDLGRALKGERILIHDGGSAVGQAAICLAQHRGAEVHATVSNIESKVHLTQAFGLDEHRISLGLPDETDKSGFDMVLICAPTNADTMRELWNILSNFGRFVVIKDTYSTTNSRLDTTDFQNNRSFMSVDLVAIALERPGLMRRILSDITDLLEQGVIRPVHINTFSISDVEKAFDSLRHGNADGKLVILPEAGAMVNAPPWNKGKNILRSDVSYILIGGTGGLGRSMARWMVDHGARNLVLVSRSGTVAGKVKTLVSELTAVGANISIKRCDVSDSSSVNALIRKDMVGMPEIKGVVHGAMVLKDVLFEKMSYEQYTTVIEAKVRGAWNFHNALKNLDFFVCLSSAAGAVGNRGQAAYSAANTFLNAFVQHRVSLGLPASSLDLTAVSDAGYLAENLEAAAEVSKNLGSDTICEVEVLALLGAAINGRLATSCNNHTITGMRLTAPLKPFWTNDAKFKHLRLAMEATENTSSEATTVSFNAALKGATSLEEAEQVVQSGLLSKLPSVLMLEAEDMDVTRSLSSYALDSLVAIEVRNFITREFEANLQVLELLSSGSIETLSKAICVKSKLVSFPS